MQKKKSHRVWMNKLATAVSAHYPFSSASGSVATSFKRSLRASGNQAGGACSTPFLRLTRHCDLRWLHHHYTAAHREAKKKCGK